jgi:hypothetical protein
MQRPGEAGGSRGAGSRASGVKRPDNVTAGRYCQTPACVLARSKGRAKANWWQKPLDSMSDPKPGGHGSLTATTPLVLSGRRAPRLACQSGRGGRRDAASACRMGCRGIASFRPGQTDHGERGKRPLRAGPRWRPGKARCRLMCVGRGGVRVVVRGRESRLHGEGGQQDRSMASRLGGRA